MGWNKLFFGGFKNEAGNKEAGKGEGGKGKESNGSGFEVAFEIGGEKDVFQGRKERGRLRVVGRWRLISWGEKWISK